MKLAFAIFRYFPFGGLQRDMLAIAHEAIKCGHQVTIFCGEWLGDKPEGIEVSVVSSSVLFNTAGIKQFVRGFEQVFQRNQFDLLLGFNKMPGLDVYFAGDSCFAQKTYEERHFLYRLTPRARLYLDYERAVFGDESHTHILSLVAAEHKHYARYYGTEPTRIHALPPGIARTQIECAHPELAAARIRSELKIAANARIILCLGSGFKTKGLDRSIAAFALLRKMTDQPLVLLVVGADNPNKFQKQASALGVADSVLFLGGRTDIADILHSVDVLLHPAYRELAGNVIVEALLTGCPVVTTDVCGYAHYVVDQHMGAVVGAPYDISYIAKAVLDVLTVNKSVWCERGKMFATTAQVFSRATQAIKIIENIAVGAYSLAMVQRSSNELVILRDEVIERWSTFIQDHSLFDKVKNLVGEVARVMPDRQTLRFEMAGQGFYRKWHHGIGWKEVVKNLLNLRLPILGAKNEWAALNKLQALNIPSLAPVAYGRRGKNPACQQSFIVTRELTNVMQVDHYFEHCQPSVNHKRCIIKKVASIARELHAAGINHRDFYLCHFMVDKQTLLLATGSPSVYLIDLHRAQCRVSVPLRWQVKDLGALYYSVFNLDFSRRDICCFLKVYFNDSLRDLCKKNLPLLKAAQRRAIKIYVRDFGHVPVLHFGLKG